MPNTLHEKIEDFRKKVEKQKKDDYIRLMNSCDFSAEDVEKINVFAVNKKAYVYINYTLSNEQICGLYMVDKKTGIVYGIKSYGKVNKNRIITQL